MPLKYAETTEKIIGCAMTVHRKMGIGYPELIYSRCLAIEFDKAGLNYEKEKQLNVYYDEHVVGGRRVDFMVEGKIVVELKAIAELSGKDFVQSLSYLESHHQEVALLINFGSKSLQFKRIINTKTTLLPPNSTNMLNETESVYQLANESKNHDYLWLNQHNPWS